MAGYQDLLPNLNPLQAALSELSDFTLPKRKLKGFRTRAEREASTLLKTQHAQLENMRRTLEQQYTSGLREVQSQRKLLPLSFEQSLQDIVSASMSQVGQRGAVKDYGWRLQELSSAANQLLARDAHQLQALAEQESVLVQTFLQQLTVHIYAAERQFAKQEGSEALKRYRQYVEEAKQALFQGRLKYAELLLIRAQYEYNALVSEAQSKLAQEQASYADLTVSPKDFAQLPKKATQNVHVTNASIQAYKQATRLGLTLTSAYRSPSKNRSVGGSRTSKHMEGRAYDFAGPVRKMDAFAQWAKSSGLFKQVLWRVKGHYDHVHVSW